MFSEMPAKKTRQVFCWGSKLLDEFRSGDVMLPVYASLVAGFNPFEKYARQIRSFPQVRVEHKKYLTNPCDLEDSGALNRSPNGR